MESRETTRAQDFWHWLDGLLREPVEGWARVVLIASVVLLVLVFTAPLWHIRLVAPQYPAGLDLYIYAHTIDSGHGGADLHEINTLNHYIGMHKLDRAALSDLDWIPFAIGALMLLTLRVAVIGDVRALIDLAAIAFYFGVFSAARFVYQLWVYGHNLDPHAPFKVDPFLPPILGSKQIANFTTTSLPGPATFFLTGYLAIVAGLAIAHLARQARMRPRPG